VTNLDHLTNTPTATPDTHSNIQWLTEMDTNNWNTQATDITGQHYPSTSEKHLGNPHHTLASLTHKRNMMHMDKPRTGKSHPKLTTNILTRHLRKYSNEKSKDSKLSMKWQPQA
jgi:hypothetical protein